MMWFCRTKPTTMKTKINKRIPKKSFFHRKYTVIEKKIVPLYAIKKTSLEEAEN